MNSQHKKNEYPQYEQPSQGIDKTFVEGENRQNVFPQLRPGTRISAASSPSVNPYTRTGSSAVFSGMGSDGLPTGNEPVPLGSGTVVGLLGAGGMAKVYKIWNEKLEVFRAVKILLPTQQADLKSRFETEAKITAKLHHPNIVEIYSVGEWNGLPYIEMEYIEGVSLETLIAKHGKLPDAVCSAIAILIARALDYAHSQEFLIYGKTYHGVIHRDLKPANIMIPNIGDVRLMDFGIARPTEASLHTVEGNIVGTMQYLSPEQMDGVDIDARTDIYSFGAILYEMLTGTKTFPQDTITNLMKKKIMNEYRKFSDFDFVISHHLARIAQKCLQINKNDRYANAASLLADLEAAHKALINQPPVKVLKTYLTDPESFESSSKRGLRLRISPKILIPVAGLLCIGGLVTVFIITGPEDIIDTDEQTAINPPTIEQTKPQMPDEQKQPVSPPPPPAGNTGEKTEGNKPTNTSSGKTGYGEKFPRPPRPDNAAMQQSITKTYAGNDAKSPPSLISPLDELKKKYGSNDFMVIGKKAMEAGDYAGAVLSLTQIPDGHPESVLKTILLLEAYLATGKLGEALVIATSYSSINDAQFDLLCGRLYERTGKDKLALEYYQSALTKRSVARDRHSVKNDALYQTAVIWSTQHRLNPTPDSRLQALNAWNTVKRTYMATPDHPRFRRANTELASIQ